MMDKVAYYAKLPNLLVVESWSLVAWSFLSCSRGHLFVVVMCQQKSATYRQDTRTIVASNRRLVVSCNAISYSIRYHTNYM